MNRKFPLISFSLLALSLLTACSSGKGSSSTASDDDNFGTSDVKSVISDPTGSTGSTGTGTTGSTGSTGTGTGGTGTGTNNPTITDLANLIQTGASNLSNFNFEYIANKEHPDPSFQVIYDQYGVSSVNFQGHNFRNFTEVDNGYFTFWEDVDMVDTVRYTSRYIKGDNVIVGLTTESTIYSQGLYITTRFPISVGYMMGELTTVVPTTTDWIVYKGAVTFPVLSVERTDLVTQSIIIKADTRRRWLIGEADSNKYVFSLNGGYDEDGYVHFGSYHGQTYRGPLVGARFFGPNAEEFAFVKDGAQTQSVMIYAKYDEFLTQLQNTN